MRATASRAATLRSRSGCNDVILVKDSGIAKKKELKELKNEWRKKGTGPSSVRKPHGRIRRLSSLSNGSGSSSDSIAVVELEDGNSPVKKGSKTASSSKAFSSPRSMKQRSPEPANNDSSDESSDSVIMIQTKKISESVLSLNKSWSASDDSVHDRSGVDQRVPSPEIIVDDKGATLVGSRARKRYHGECEMTSNLSSGPSKKPMRNIFEVITVEDLPEESLRSTEASVCESSPTETKVETVKVLLRSADSGLQCSRPLKVESDLVGDRNGSVSACEDNDRSVPVLPCEPEGSIHEEACVNIHEDVPPQASPALPAPLPTTRETGGNATDQENSISQEDSARGVDEVRIESKENQVEEDQSQAMVSSEALRTVEKVCLTSHDDNEERSECRNTVEKDNAALCHCSIPIPEDSQSPAVTSNHRQDGSTIVAETTVAMTAEDDGPAAEVLETAAFAEEFPGNEEETLRISDLTDQFNSTSVTATQESGLVNEETETNLTQRKEYEPPPMPISEDSTECQQEPLPSIDVKPVVLMRSSKFEELVSDRCANATTSKNESSRTTLQHNDTNPNEAVASEDSSDTPVVVKVKYWKPRSPAASTVVKKTTSEVVTVSTSDDDVVTAVVVQHNSPPPPRRIYDKTIQKEFSCPRCRRSYVLLHPFKVHLLKCCPLDLPKDLPLTRMELRTKTLMFSDENIARAVAELPGARSRPLSVSAASSSQLTGSSNTPDVVYVGTKNPKLSRKAVTTCSRQASRLPTPLPTCQGNNSVKAVPSAPHSLRSPDRQSLSLPNCPPETPVPRISESHAAPRIAEIHTATRIAESHVTRRNSESHTAPKITECRAEAANGNSANLQRVVNSAPAVSSPQPPVKPRPQDPRTTPLPVQLKGYLGELFDRYMRLHPQPPVTFEAEYPDETPEENLAWVIYQYEILNEDGMHHKRWPKIIGNMAKEVKTKELSQNTQTSQVTKNISVRPLSSTAVLPVARPGRTVKVSSKRGKAMYEDTQPHPRYAPCMPLRLPNLDAYRPN